jgi:hypothetical protein
MGAPPLPGKVLSVKVDQTLYDDLLTLMQDGGMTQSEAVKYGVAKLAMEKRQRAYEAGMNAQQSGITGYRPAYDKAG